MSGADDTAPVAPIGAAVPERLLNEGEVVILAMKPSIWFVVLTSWPAVSAVLALGLAAYILGDMLGLQVGHQLVLFFCATVALGQLFVACFEWVGRLYILTNVRILTLRGVLKPQFSQCPLKKIENIALSITTSERLFAVGSIYFQAEGFDHKSAWFYISQPQEVCDAVNEAVRRTPRS